MTANWRGVLECDWVEYAFDVLKFDLLIRCSTETEDENAMPRYSFRLN